MKHVRKNHLLKKVLSLITFMMMFVMMMGLGFSEQKTYATENGEGLEYGPYYAIDALYEDGVYETANVGYSGEAYVNLDNKVGSNIKWTVDVEEAGNYLVTFRIANGSVADRKMKIEVNDAKDWWLQSFTSTGNWTTWEERGIVLPMNAGTNTIKATSYTDDGGPNLDYIKLEKTDEPIAGIYDPNSDENQAEANKTKVYIAGDSTAQSYAASYAPQQGWGYYLDNHLDESVDVINKAIAGRSSKSFYDNGRLDSILDVIKPGDYLLVQFGINDSAYNKPERYAPVCGEVINPAEGSFEYYIEKYIEGALEHEAIPVVMSTTIGLKAYSASEGRFVNSYTNYAEAMESMADYYHIPYIDLNSLMVEHYNEIGYEAASLYHLYGVVEGSTDMTHFSEEGADKAAELISVPFNEIIRERVSVEVKTYNNWNSINQIYTISSKEGTIDLNKVKIVFQGENLPLTEENFHCDWAGMMLKVKPWYVSLTSSVEGEFTKRGLEITVNNENTLTSGDGSAVLNIRFNKDNWSPYGDLGVENVSIYYDGVLIK